MNKIRAIGFDYSGVLYGPPGFLFMEVMANVLETPLDTLRAMYFTYNHRMNVDNAMSWEDLWKHLAVMAGHSEKQEEVVKTIERWEKKRGLNAEVLALVGTLRSSGYTVGLLSNYADGLRQELDRLGIANQFDAIGISSEMGAMKPDPKIFVAFCEMLGVAPSELVFVDDAKKSLETAESVGYTPILFRDFEGLKKELVALGVLGK